MVSRGQTIKKRVVVMKRVVQYIRTRTLQLRDSKTFRRNYSSALFMLYAR